jgi:predicted dehydrogenase
MTTKAELKFKNGAISSIECSMDDKKPFQAELSVWGTKGKIHFENPLAPHDGHLITFEKNGQVQTEQVKGRSTYDLQLEYAIDVTQGKVSAYDTLRDSVSNMAVIDAIYRKANLPPR